MQQLVNDYFINIHIWKKIYFSWHCNDYHGLDIGHCTLSALPLHLVVKISRRKKWLHLVFFWVYMLCGRCMLWCFGGMYCLYLKDDWIWFTLVLKLLGRSSCVSYLGKDGGNLANQSCGGELWLAKFLPSSPYNGHICFFPVTPALMWTKRWRQYILLKRQNSHLPHGIETKEG